MTPYLPPAIWARIFTHVFEVADLGSLARVCVAWRDELRGHHSSLLWRDVYDSRARKGRLSAAFTLPAFSSWRAQVAACKLLGSHHAKETRTIVPARRGSSFRQSHANEREGHYVEEWSVRCSVDSLGKARCVHAFTAGPVLVGFERGVALVRSPQPFFAAPVSALRDGERSGACSVVDVEQSAMLGGILLFAKASGESPVFAATTTRRVVAIDVDLSTPHATAARARGVVPAAAPLSRARPSTRMQCLKRKRLIRWRSLDNFEMTDGHIVSLVLPEDRRQVLASFSGGHVRVICVETAQLLHVLSMRESPDILCASERWIVASHFGTRPCASAWDRRDGRAVHRWERTSVGWEEIAQIVGMTPTSRQDYFGIWDGHKVIRLLDVRTGRFVRDISAQGNSVQRRRRSVKDEAEFGAAAAQAGPCKMVVSLDGRHVIVAASNRVMIVDIHTTSALERATGMRQLDARHSIMTLSTDNRFVVTAESNPFGALGTRFATRPSQLCAAPMIRVWDVETGRLVREIPGVGRNLVDLSIANNVIAVVGVGRQEGGELGSACGEALLISLDI
jgi:F-box-like